MPYNHSDMRSTRLQSSSNLSRCRIRKSTSAPQSVHRILGILRALAMRDKGLTLTALAQELKAPKTSLVGLLNGLVDGGYLIRDETAYHFGQEMLILATQIAANMRLSEMVLPSLRRLMVATGETAFAGQIARDGETLIHFAKEESANPVRYTAPVGKREELYSTAMGKLFLAHMEPSKQKRYIEDKVQCAYTSQTVLDIPTLLRQLTAISETGISHSIDERVIGASAVAVAVEDKDGSLLFGLGLAGPTERMVSARDFHVDVLRQEAVTMRRWASSIPDGVLRSPI